MPLQIVLYSPDRSQQYDGRTPATTGVGGGITARISLLEALAARGHAVTAYVNCADRLRFHGVDYVPLAHCTAITCDLLIAITTGGDRSFVPLSRLPIAATRRVLWVQGVSRPAGIDLLAPDTICVASNFLRDVCVDRWGVEPSRIFTCYNGLDQASFAAAEGAAAPRDPFAVAYIGPQEKGLDAAIEVLRRLRRADPRYHLDVFGGGALWGAEDPAVAHEPGVAFKGLLGQRSLVPELFRYEYALALQSIEEGFGIGVQEAKRAGQIVIASRVGAFGELIRSSVDGYLVDGPHHDRDVHDLAATIVLDLARHAARRARLRRAAMRTPWSWAMAADTWEQQFASPPIASETRFVERADGRHDTITGHYYPTPYPASPMHDRLRPPPRVLLGGYYGHRNAGDEAIADVTIEQLRDAVPTVQVTIVSADTWASRRQHDVASVYERDIPGMLEAARASDLIVLGGGGLLHDYAGVDTATLMSHLHWGLTYCAAFPALASLFDKPFLVWGQGVGPLSTEAGRQWVSLIVERANAATVRDAASLAVLEAIGTDTSHVSATADQAHLVESASAEWTTRYLDAVSIAPDARLLGVAVRAWPPAGDGWMHELAAALDRLIEERQLTVLLVPFHTEPGGDADDTAVARQLQAMMRHTGATRVAQSDLRASEIQALFGRSELVIAMRLHGVILAGNAGTPAIGLVYDPKVRQALEQLDQADHAIDLPALTADATCSLAARLLADRESTSRRVAQRAASLAVDARRGAAIAVDLVSRLPAARPATAAWRARMDDMVTRQIARATVAEWQLEERAHDLGRAMQTTTALVAALAGANRRMLALLASLALDDLAPVPAPAPAVGADAEERHRDTRADLEARTRELAARDRDVASATRELSVIYGSRAWRAISAYRTVRRRLGTALRHPVRAAAIGVRALVPMRARRSIRQAWHRRLMSPYMYLFDRYRRTRLERYGVDVSRLRAPGEPGLVSVILPAYNGAALMREAIESVLAQTYRQLELVIVNDGSTDATPEIADEYARRDPRVRVEHQANQRLPRALSRGFALARGEFLTWTSCDNRMKPDCVERLVASLRRHPAWDMVYANLDVIGDDGAPLRGSTHYEGYQRPHGSEHVFLPRSTAELNVWANNSVGAAFLYRRHVPFLVGDYDHHRFVMEDYDYWMRINALLTLKHADFDDPVYEYRFHGESLTARWEEFRMLQNRDRLMVFEEFRRDFYLSPMVWLLEGEDTPLTRGLTERIRRTGHLLARTADDLTRLPRAGVPVVHARIAADPAAAARAPAVGPPSALRVCIALGAELPREVDAAWDLCVAVRAGESLTLLPGHRQGWLGAADAETLFRAIDVRAKTDHVNAVESLAEAPEPATLDASVVICTHRFSPRVVTAIESALDQTLPRHRYEIIVVDNAPPSPELDDTLQTLRLRRGCTQSNHLRVVHCPIAGLSPARNAGLCEARGGIVCFLDDDAIADPDWLERLCDAYAAHPDAGVIGGHIALTIPDPRPAALRPGWEKYWSQFLPGYSEYTPVQHWWEFPWGANWSARRTPLLQIGGFRSQYGRKGNDFGGGEELIAAALIQRLGHTVAVLPDARVAHDVDPERFSFDHVRRTMLAGHLVSYQAQRDLYIPREAGVRTTLMQIAGRHVDASLPRRDLRRDFVYRKQAQLRLLSAQIAELRARRRRAVVDGHDEGK